MIRRIHHCAYCQRRAQFIAGLSTLGVVGVGLVLVVMVLA